MPGNVRCAIADIDVTIRNRDSWLPQMEKKIGRDIRGFDVKMRRLNRLALRN